MFSDPRSFLTPAPSPPSPRPPPAVVRFLCSGPGHGCRRRCGSIRRGRPGPITTPPKRRRRTSLGDFNQLLGLDGVVPLTSGDIPEGSEAVLYLRVSTARQMSTAIDIDEDGNSIATQREVGTKRCRRLNAPIAREFVEPGNSAQSIAKRPVFRELLRYVEATPQIGYVVIYMRSRAFRNYTDAAIAKRVLAAMGVKLVSAKEEFGEGYMADAMEAITDIMRLIHSHPQVCSDQGFRWPTRRL